MAKKKINFEGTPKEIKKGGKSRHIPEGDYLVKIVSGDYQTSEKKGTTYINWRFQVASGTEKGATIYTNTSLVPKALWNLRNLIHAATGKNVAGKTVGFDPASLVGKIVAATAVDDEYGDKMRTVLEDFRPKDELEEDDDSEDDDSEEESETEEEEELEEVDIDDL